MYFETFYFSLIAYISHPLANKERWVNTSHSQSSSFIRTNQSVQELAQLNGLLDGAETEGIPDTDPPTAKELIERIVSLLPHSGQSI
jgi:hypothetical protein